MLPVEELLRQRALELPLEALAEDTIGDSVERLVRHHAPLQSNQEQAALAERVLARLRGLGPLESLLETSGVTEIMVNGPGPIWIECNGQLSETAFVLRAEELDHVIERIVAPLGRRLDRTSPLVDGRLPGGARVHVAASPVALDGPYLTIRRFEVRHLDIAEMASSGTAAMLRWAVQAGANIMVVGGTGTGKTTLLNALCRSVPEGERIVTIEEAAELRLEAPHVLRLEARPPSADGPPEVGVRQLVRNALRMRPDRIIVGEVRGGEAVDMLAAMNTGHAGSLSTIHANSARDALARLETLVLLGSPMMPLAAIQQQIGRCIDLVVSLERSPDGARAITEVCEPALDGSDQLRQLADKHSLIALPSRSPRRPSSPPDEGWVGQ